MFVRFENIQSTLRIAFFVFVIALPTTAVSRDDFDHPALRGEFVLYLDGSFASAPPPFTGIKLSFQAAQVGRLVFDGAGLVWGEGTLTFHHPTLSSEVVSQLALRGSYEVSPNGKAMIRIDEFPIDVNGDPGPVRTNSIVYECYMVRRQLLSRCVAHSLISYQQGPEPRKLPVTMSGSLQRQL